MKTSVIVFGLALLTAEASSVGPLQLPRSAFADTEAATNVPVAFGQQGVRNFCFGLAFAGTASNNVQLAFGRDADADGVLAAAETDLTFAWDCGRWAIRDSEGSESFAAAATTNVVKELDWDLSLRRRRPRCLTVTENGAAIFAELAQQPADWFFDPNWNLVRLTVRGVDAPEEEARVELKIQGYVLHVR